MQPAYNPWGSSQPNWNQNPFCISDAFVDNGVFRAERNHYALMSHGNENFSGQQQANPWLPSNSTWNDNSYDPRLRANPSSQWLPTPQSFQSRGPPLSPIQVLRKDWISLSIPTSVLDVDPHFQRLKELFWKFLLDPHNPSQIFDSLVKELIMCSKNTNYINKIQNFIYANLGNNPNPNLILKEYMRMAPHERMRIFWLLGEIFRPEYDACFEATRQIFRADDMFQEFLRKTEVKREYLDEFQVIWCYWKKYVPKNVTDRIIVSSCPQLTYIMNSAPDQSTCKLFYNKTLGYNEHLIHVNVNPRYGAIALDCDSHYCAAVNMPVMDKSNETGNIQRNNVVSHISFSDSEDSKSEESFEFTETILEVTSLLDKLVTVDCSDVPKTVSDVLHCFLEHGNDHKLSDQISRDTEDVLKATNNCKTIRILWVIGYLFLPKYESKLTALKPLVEIIAARLFWIGLWKTHKDKDTSSRQEMRTIFKFWCEVVNNGITSSITGRIKDATANDPDTNMAWILDDKAIRKGTRMSHFYRKYLPKSDKTDHDKIKKPESEAKKNSEQFMLDKCDVIKATSKQKNWEDKLAVKHKSDNTLHTRRKLKKRKTRNEGHTDKIFTEFHRVSSKPVNLVKPLLRTRVNEDDKCEPNNDNGSDKQQQSRELSKLELFRKMMENDEAIKTIGGGGGGNRNDASFLENNEAYLRENWSVDDFVYYVCSDEFQTSWDIVKLKSGEVRVKIVRT